MSDFYFGIARVDGCASGGEGQEAYLYEIGTRVGSKSEDEVASGSACLINYLHMTCDNIDVKCA